jgi:hypothetical protein
LSYNWTAAASAPEAKTIDKSDYEKQLDKQMSEGDDPDKKQRLQRELDRERARRKRQQAANQYAADVASQLKAQKVADNRAHGGSRFNLRIESRHESGRSRKLARPGRAVVRVGLDRRIENAGL